MVVLNKYNRKLRKRLWSFLPNHAIQIFLLAIPQIWVLKKITWIDETTLKVKAYVSINYAEEIESGNYEITNDKIILIYKSPRCKDVCAHCLCVHELVYNFTNLKRKDYQFGLKRIE